MTVKFTYNEFRTFNFEFSPLNFEFPTLNFELFSSLDMSFDICFKSKLSICVYMHFIQDMPTPTSSDTLEIDQPVKSKYFFSFPDQFLIV